MTELKELENEKKFVLTDFNHLDSTHFSTLRHPCLGRDPYFGNRWAREKIIFLKRRLDKNRRSLEKGKDRFILILKKQVELPSIWWYW